jgi:hypothetical protein
VTGERDGEWLVLNLAADYPVLSRRFGLRVWPLRVEGNVEALLICAVCSSRVQPVGACAGSCCIGAEFGGDLVCTSDFWGL